jgi:hypothetical protein
VIAWVKSRDFEVHDLPDTLKLSLRFSPAKIDRVFAELSRVELLAALNRSQNLDILYLVRIYLQWIAIELY